MAKGRSLFSQKSSIVDVRLSSKYATSTLSFFLYLASKEGTIKVWNMCMHSYPYVGCFRGHLKKILGLAIHPKEQLLLSASEDSTIRLWRIETFNETYRFDIMDSIETMTLINPKTLFYSSKKSLCILDLNMFHSLFTLIGSKIKSMTAIHMEYNPSRIFLIAEDGGARIISPTHGNILTTLFPIVTHKPISYVHDALEEKIYVLLEEGDVMVVSTKTNPCR